MCSELLLMPSFEIVRIDRPFSRVMCWSQMALFDHSALFSFLTISIPWDGRLLQRLYRFADPRDRVKTSEGEGSSELSFGDSLGMAIILRLAVEVARDGAELVVIGRPIDLATLDLGALKSARISVIGLDAVANVPPLEVRWTHDSHFNPEGHRLVADAIRPEIERLLQGGE
jgi:hypothetical protein